MRPRPTFRIALRAEPHVADTIKALRRGLKFLLRACGLRAISVVELHPDPAKAAEESESLDIAGGSR
jgi:hypothetical protein